MPDDADDAATPPQLNPTANLPALTDADAGIRLSQIPATPPLGTPAAAAKKPDAARVAAAAPPAATPAPAPRWMYFAVAALALAALFLAAAALRS